MMRTAPHVRRKQQYLVQRYLLFTTSVNVDTSSGGSHVTSKRPLNKTPRGVAAAKMKPLNGTSAVLAPQLLQQPGLTNTRHSATHFVKGGTPCDPECPDFRLADYGEESLYTLILLRHGESEWNSQNRYTGWCDVNLTKRGELEARAAGRLLYENGIELDHIFTSVLKRASFSANMCLNMAKQHWVPVTKTWRLNERHYGALQGYNKDTAFAELDLDQELVMQMRRSYDTRPPVMQDDHPYWHGADRRYKKLSHQQLENTRTESLKDCADRILPFFNSVICPSIKSGNKCMIVSHANTIRTLIKHIDNISDEDIKGMSIPTGIPLLYRLDKNLKPVDPNYDLDFQYMVEPKGYTWGTSRAHGFHGVYLGDLERLQDIQRKRDVTNRDWQRIILRNIGKSLIQKDGQDDDDDNEDDGNCEKELSSSKSSGVVFETRQLWWQLHTKMKEKPEYEKMLLLVRMKDHLENLMYARRQRFLTYQGFDSIVQKLHLDAEGQIIEPFVALADQEDRDERQRIWHESLALDLEEECLIK
mmetsp:Transcript_22289/g.36895  ORF Transcript_22289/g.36895 Transcript_22289/m.36895 type:complete len:531 (-) Transcript_22289:26-1618(-)